MTTEATPTSISQNVFSFPQVGIAAASSPAQQPILTKTTPQQRQGQPQQSQLLLQQPQQFKSILKSPSTTSEKSIHFDDHIDVIQIEDRLSTATSSPLSSQSQPPELDTPTGTETKGEEQSPSPVVNLDLFKPLKGVSQTEMAKNLLFQRSGGVGIGEQQQYAQQQQAKSAANLIVPPQSRFSNEIEAIKKMLLEPVVNKQRADTLDAPDHVRVRNVGSERSRVFIKSPTPMRELPDFYTLGQGTSSHSDF